MCEQQGIKRIGCWDHARRKFVEASRAGPAGKGKGKAPGAVAKADVALSHIRQLYRIEQEIADRRPGEKRRARQALLPWNVDLPRFEKTVPAYPQSK